MDTGSRVRSTIDDLRPLKASRSSRRGESKEIATEFINSNDQPADILTKSLRGPRIQFICSKLGAYDLYAPA